MGKMRGTATVVAAILAQVATAQTIPTSSETDLSSVAPSTTAPGSVVVSTSVETITQVTTSTAYTTATATTWATVIVTLTVPVCSSASSSAISASSVAPPTSSSSASVSSVAPSTSSVTPSASSVTPSASSAAPSESSVTTSASSTGQAPSSTAGQTPTVTDVCNLGYGTQNGGTKGGAGGGTTTVSAVPQLSAAASGATPLIIVVAGTLVGSGRVDVGSSKSIIGAAGSSITGVNFRIKKQSNVILRNLNISKVVGNDGITVENSKNIWIDHCELSSDLAHDKDYYDGALDITHGSDWVTVSNTYFHDHWKTSLVGHSDKNAGEDQGHLHVTYAYNHWNNINSRAPSFRFGTGHVYNSFFRKVGGSGINTRMGAQLLIQSSAFEESKKAITTDDSDKTGYATVEDVSLGGSTNTAPKGNMTTAAVPYRYSLLGSEKVKAAVVASAGQTLRF